MKTAHRKEMVLTTIYTFMLFGSFSVSGTGLVATLSSKLAGLSVHTRKECLPPRSR
jgi:hypothetical protein